MAHIAAEELEVKTSTESAETFVNWFYNNISDRKPLHDFYVNSNAKYASAGAAADISVNGLACPTPADFESLLEQQVTGSAKATKTANGGATNGSLHGAASSASSSSLRVKYTVEGFDVHVLNPQFRLACPDVLLQRVSTPPTTTTTYSAAQLTQLRQRMVSLLVQVTGNVQYGMHRDAPRGAFTEVFVLVPNWDLLAAPPKAAPRGMRSYLILSQNYRAL